MAKFGKKEWGGVCLAIGAGAVTALLPATGLRVWQVEALIVVGGMGLSFAVFLFAKDRWLSTSVSDAVPRWIVLLAASWIIPVCVGLRVMPLPSIRPFYQESVLLTKVRQDRITWDINDFYDYLSAVGFKIPPKTPAIGTRAGTVPAEAGIYPGVDVQTAILIPEDRIDDSALAEQLYGNMLFAEPFGANDPSSPSHYIDKFASMLFSSYYVSSFNGHNISPPGYKWGNALWNLRTKYGQRTMDSMMLAVSETWSPAEHGPVDPARPDFDGVFARNLSSASSMLGRPPGEIESVLEAEGIKVRKAQ